MTELKNPGEIISWTVRGASVNFASLKRAIVDAGLDESFARELFPKSAFSRACKKLCDHRIIRKVFETENEIVFQFTNESKAGDIYAYAIEAKVYLNKTTGVIDCDVDYLRDLARLEMDAAMDARTSSDITSIVQKIFTTTADIFSVRPQGGCYFVPRHHIGLVEQVEKMLSSLNGTMMRFPLAPGTTKGNQSVRQAVESGLEQMIEDHRAAVEAFDEKTRESTLDRAVERINVTQFKLQAYSEFLEDARQNLEDQLQEIKQQLREKISAAHAEESSLPELAAA